MATKAGKQLMTMVIVKLLPRPDRPTNRKSLNLATWFFITAVWFRSSPQKFSSFPALTDTNVPSGTSWNVNTLNPMGRDLLDLQWLGRGEHKMHGDPVCTSSPCSPRNSCNRWSGTMTSGGGLVIVSSWDASPSSESNQSWEEVSYRWPCLLQSLMESWEVSFTKKLRKLMLLVNARFDATLLFTRGE